MSRRGNNHRGNKKRNRPTHKAGPTPHVGLTPERRDAVLAQLKLTGILQDAADAVGVNVMTLYKWRKDNPDFEEECILATRSMDARIAEKARMVLEMELDDLRVARIHSSSKSGLSFRHL